MVKVTETNHHEYHGTSALIGDERPSSFMDSTPICLLKQSLACLVPWVVLALLPKLLMLPFETATGIAYTPKVVTKSAPSIPSPPSLK